MDSTRICRYFRLNLLVTRFSIGKIIGINCYSFPLQRNLSSKSHHKSHLLSFFDSRSKINFIINFYLDYISILYIYIILSRFRCISIRSWLHVPNISISLHPVFLFCSNSVMKNRSEKETFISSLLFIYFIFIEFSIF